MFQVPSTADDLQAAIDILNMQKFRELSARAANVGMVLTFALSTPEEEQDEEDGLGRFLLPVQERLAATEELIEEEEALR